MSVTLSIRKEAAENRLFLYANSKKINLYIVIGERIENAAIHLLYRPQSDIQYYTPNSFRLSELVGKLLCVRMAASLSHTTMSPHCQYQSDSRLSKRAC